jgi:hypothetical protein
MLSQLIGHTDASFTREFYAVYSTDSKPGWLARLHRKHAKVAGGAFVWGGLACVNRYTREECVYECSKICDVP